MKDCSSCPNKPLPGTDYHATPCAHCTPCDDKDLPHAGQVEYTPAFDNPSRKTWRRDPGYVADMEPTILSDQAQELSDFLHSDKATRRRLELNAHKMPSLSRLLSRFTTKQLDLLALLIQTGVWWSEISCRTIGQGLGITPQAAHKQLKQIVAILPELKFILTPNTKDKS